MKKNKINEIQVQSFSTEIDSNALHNKKGGNEWTQWSGCTQQTNCTCSGGPGCDFTTHDPQHPLCE